MARVKIGDVVEVSTPTKGLCYAQVIAKSPRYGHLLRVFEAGFEVRPAEISSVVRGAVQFVCYFPLQAAVNQGILSIVAHERELGEVPRRFKLQGFIGKGGEVHDWWIISDGEERQVRTLSEDQKRLPYQEIINDTLLVERLDSGWRHETNL